jgi:hypothetical protein
MKRWISRVGMVFWLFCAFCAGGTGARAQDPDGFGLRPASVQSDPLSVLLEVFVAGDLGLLYGGDDGLWGQDVLDEISVGQLKEMSFAFEYNYPAVAWTAVPVVAQGVGGGDVFDAVQVEVLDPIALVGKVPAMAFNVLITGVASSLADLEPDVVLATIRVSRPTESPGEFLLKKVRLGDRAEAGDGTATMAAQTITPIPEPGTLGFVGVGLCGVLLGVHRRRRQERG